MEKWEEETIEKIKKFNALVNNANAPIRELSTVLGKGFSIGTISDICNSGSHEALKEKNTSKKRSNFSTKLDEAINKISHYLNGGTAKASEKEIAKKLQLYFNKKFYAYFFSDLAECVTRTIIEFGDDSNVKIHNIEGKSNYIGKVELHCTLGFLILILHTEETSENSLHIKFAIGEDSIHPIALGKFLNITGKQEIVAETIILERIPNNCIEPITATLLFQNKAEYEQTHPAIIQFFDTRENMIRRISEKIYNYEELTNVNERNRISTILAPKGNDEDILSRVVNNDIYISSPINQLAEKDYTPLKESIRKIATYLEETFACNVYYVGFKKSPEKLFLPNFAFPRAIQQLEKSSKMILIYPQKVQSSSFFELGIALSRGMSGVICCKSREDLPYLVQGIEKHPNFNIIEYQDDNLDDLFINIKNLGFYLFP